MPAWAEETASKDTASNDTASNDTASNDTASNDTASNDVGDDDASRRSRARALASPLRMRILRLCLHEARTNRQLAEALGMNPGTMLHHVRSLVDNGFLRAEDPRRGARGAREVPYRATGLSWRSGTPEMSPVLIETFLEEIEGLRPDELMATRLGLKLTPSRRDELLERIDQVLREYATGDPDPDGEPISILFVEHPDRLASSRSARGSEGTDDAPSRTPSAD